jgi:hypothetical protein
MVGSADELDDEIESVGGAIVKDQRNCPPEM